MAEHSEEIAPVEWVVGWGRTRHLPHAVIRDYHGRPIGLCWLRDALASDSGSSGGEG